MVLDRSEVHGAVPEGLLESVQALWSGYLHQDVPGSLALMAPDVTRLSQRAGRIQQGVAEVAAQLPAEWSAFERPHNVIAEQLTLRDVRVRASGGAAIVQYWLEVEGGARWTYDDQGLVVQAFQRQGSSWKLVHQTDAWSLDYDLDEGRPGRERTFAFDFAYPVERLERAVRFYTPLLGKPEFESPTRACFNLQGARFWLDVDSLGGRARAESGFPNGYAVLAVKDLGKAEPLPSRDGDPRGLRLDPSGNVLVLLQARLATAGQPAPVGPLGFPSDLEPVRALESAWLRMDIPRLEGSWFDDSRSRVWGVEPPGALASGLGEHYWKRYDHGPAGLALRLEVDRLHQRQLGPYRLVSYQRKLTGLGRHPCRERSLATQILEGSRVLATYLVANDSGGAMTRELDYTGYPVTDLERARAFYSSELKMGSPYSDEDYYGWWSNQLVFGVYAADPSQDGIPRPGRSNGYLSLWVRSLAEAEAYVRGHGCKFLHFPAINDGPGVESQPGYTQLLTTDSEGNALLLSQYTGRPR